MDDVASTASITAAITILALSGISFILTRYGEFCFMERMMILVISATYLCRRGDIDGAVYAGIAIFGFIELLVEIALLASVLGR
ncbi:hypothetical protein FW717_06770 [Salmonella enterica subsp. enterica serovar Ago]|nr:hypothetical protein [Salmonella enterica]EDQ9934738.1 hypothetical protein [Salmonella enterica subsp. enterica]EDR3714068.1 hypothetical protein [Salmonella enterica subsp. enterica serovar Abony]EEF6658096.1 hypothetical protein [Salmonella enterica subsp. enterica serovar Ago]EEJ6642818.1 hypothetical protein [Salmonella enterica subsp. enterica serovar Aderike]HBL9940929.1 hypothetical protein [Salmonella enterica subsp. enterica serovar Ago]